MKINKKENYNFKETGLKLGSSFRNSKSLMSCKFTDKFSVLLKLKIDHRNNPEIWPPGDIKPGRETCYTSWLTKRINKRDVVNREIHDCVLFNLIKKFNLICQVMKRCNVDFKIDFPHTESCLIMACASGATDVCLRIIQEADPAYLIHSMQKEVEYKGVTALHCAVSNGLFDVIEELMQKLNTEERLKLLNSHVDGSYFINKMHVSSLALHLSCWICSKSVFEQLLKFGAELDSKDLHGNTILHTLVELGKGEPDLAQQSFTMVLNSESAKKWFCLKTQEDWDHWTTQDDIEFRKLLLCIENNDGYTPLTLAAKIGAYQMLKFILNIEGVYRTTMWCFGPSAFAVYNMAEVDPSVAQRKCPGKPNVIDLLVYRRIEKDVLPAYSLPVLEHLISYKWKYHRYMYVWWALLHILLMISVYLLTMSVVKELAVANNQTSVNASSPSNGPSARHIITESKFLTALAIFIATSICIGFTGEGYDIALGVVFFVLWVTRRYTKKVYNAPLPVVLKMDIFRIVYTLFLIFQILSMYDMLFKSRFTIGYAAPATLLGWYFLQFFLQGFRNTGYFSILLHYVLFTDVISFAFVFIIMLIGFGVAIMLAFYDPANMSSIPEGFQDLGSSSYTMFKFMTGFAEGDYSEYENNVVVTVVFVIFVCLTVILLLNMLIAAMSETYATLTPHREELWIRSRAAAMLIIERRMFAKINDQLIKRYMHYDKDRDTWGLLIETSVPASCPL